MENNLKKCVGTLIVELELEAETGSNPAMSNPNGLLSQKLCHQLCPGGTMNGMLMRAAH